MAKHLDIIEQFSKKHLLVIGDLILDQYIIGNVSRISPEAPVPVVLQEDTFYTPGGSANVGNNLSSLGCKVTLVGKVGKDSEAEILKKELKERNIELAGVLNDPAMDTIFKTRIMAQHQQIVRLDREKILDSDLDFENKYTVPFIRENFDFFDGVIISDYGKGMITPSLVAEVSKLAYQKGIPIVVDPKVEHFEQYGHVTSITPNRKEAETALRNIYPQKREDLGIISTQLNMRESIEAAGQGLLKHLGIDSLLITLGELGMYVFEHGQSPFPIPTRAKEVFDVSGAGDTVISVFTLALSCGADKKVAADIANHAAGVVVGKMGAVAITTNELVDSMEEF